MSVAGHHRCGVAKQSAQQLVRSAHTVRALYGEHAVKRIAALGRRHVGIDIRLDVVTDADHLAAGGRRLGHGHASESRDPIVVVLQGHISVFGTVDGHRAAGIPLTNRIIDVRAQSEIDTLFCCADDVIGGG